MTRLTYAPNLVEETVLLAERSMSAADAKAFRRERDRTYEIADEETREASFQSFHRRWFARLAIDRRIEQLVHERADVADLMEACRVLRAFARRDEGADLVDQFLPGASPAPVLVLRLCAATLLEPVTLGALLRHELGHVADMLDPSFGYERTLPESEAGPATANLLRDRYRVLWDVTIDGRLARAGLAGARERAARWREFAATFAMLGEGCRSAFEEWFHLTCPRHAALVQFAQAPIGGVGLQADPRSAGGISRQRSRSADPG